MKALAPKRLSYVWNRFGPRLWFHPLFGQSIYQAVFTLGVSNGKSSWSSGNIICLTGAEEEKTRSLSLNVMLHSAINPSGNKAGRRHKTDTSKPFFLSKRSMQPRKGCLKSSKGDEQNSRVHPERHNVWRTPLLPGQTKSKCTNRLKVSGMDCIESEVPFND